MGVPGLARRLEPYTTRYSSQDLVDYVAIVDGPSLAYHAHKLALANSSNQLRIPSYTEVNNEAISWLNSLEQQGIKVSQIFFDGALPEAKRPERLARTEQNNRKVHQLRSNYPTTSCPVPVYLGSTSYAFLAPSLCEALNDSPYSMRVSIVPGEADDFCALHARPLPRSVIFTSDTDLLLYDYEPETLIVFYQDAELPTGLKAFSPQQTKEKLQLQSLVQLAYVVQQRTSESQEDLIKDARAINEVSAAAYADFSKRYVANDVASPQLHVDLKNVAHRMDVRTSEFVYQALDSKIHVHVYLPLLVEDPNQASAWNICQEIRIIAYSLLASQIKCVQEYKRKAQGISPQELFAISPPLSLDRSTEDLATRIVSFKAWAELKDCRPTILWALFALGLVVPELNTPPSLSLVARVLNGDFDNTWAFIQLTARLQAAIYSLRMLKQISSAYLVTHRSSSDMTLCKNITKIEENMSSFPSIADSIIVPGQIKRVLADHDTLTSLIEEIYTSLGIEIPADPTSNKKKKRQAREADRKKRKAEQRQQNQPQGTTNVFALLDRT